MPAFKMTHALPILAAIVLTTGCSSSHQATGQNNGALSYATASYTPAPALRTADRYPRLAEPQMPAAVNQHLYAPAAR